MSELNYLLDWCSDRLKYYGEDRWGVRRFMDEWAMNSFHDRGFSGVPYA